MRRVVVTGMGVVSALGAGVDAFWQRLVAGESGLRTIRAFDPAPFGSQFAGEVDGFPPGAHDRFAQFALAAAQEAVAAAGGNVQEAIIRIGTAFGGVSSLEQRRFPQAFASQAVDLAAAELGIRGNRLTYQASFTGGTNAIGEAFEAIRQGRASVALAGGSDAAITPTVLAGFIAMGATSQSVGDPARAVKPFAGDRDGCAIGEGSAMLVLEEREHAIARGAPILAELVGYGTTADAHHVVALPDDGDGLVRAMELALDQAGIAPETIGYINAHGTGTAMNDAIETVAMKHVFGPHAGRIPISSTKPATGHLLGAAGALEAVIAIQAMRTGIAPPTLNLHVPDPQCDLDYVPLVARPLEAGAVMSNSMGFGGHAASLIFARADRPPASPPRRG